MATNTAPLTQQCLEPKVFIIMYADPGTHGNQGRNFALAAKQHAEDIKGNKLQTTKFYKAVPVFNPSCDEIVGPVHVNSIAGINTVFGGVASKVVEYVAYLGHSGWSALYMHDQIPTIAQNDLFKYVEQGLWVFKDNIHTISVPKFSDTAKIFLLGCNAGNTGEATGNTIAQDLANHFKKETYGFGSSSLFTNNFEHIKTGKGYEYDPDYKLDPKKGSWLRPAPANGKINVFQHQ